MSRHKTYNMNPRGEMHFMLLLQKLAKSKFKKKVYAAKTTVPLSCTVQQLSIEWSHCMVSTDVKRLYHLTPDSDNSKSDNVPKLQIGKKIEKQTVSQSGTAEQLSNEWAHFRVLTIESKVRKLCITQGFTLGVRGLTNSTTVKYRSTPFQ